MTPLWCGILYSAFIVAGSLLGGWLPSRVRLTHDRMQIVLSFVGGLMLGIGLLHLLPHAVAQLGQPHLAFGSAMVGLLVMFFLIRIFQFHQHEVEDDPHHQGHTHSHAEGHSSSHRLSWIGVAVGLSLHTLIDGVALGAAILADSKYENSFPLYGVGVFLAILLHKPLDAMSITSLMAAGGWTHSARQWINLAFALMCPIGAIAVLLGIGPANASSSMLLGCALGFSAGVFLCISLGDLLPEVQFHQHDRWKLSAMLLLGVTVAYLIGYLEPRITNLFP